jgi:hypothetical protein
MMTVPHDVGAAAKAHHHKEKAGPEQEVQNVLQLHDPLPTSPRPIARYRTFTETRAKNIDPYQGSETEFESRSGQNPPVPLTG